MHKHTPLLLYTMSFTLRNSFVVSHENPRTPTLVPSSGVLTNSRTNDVIMSEDGTQTYEVYVMLKVQKNLQTMPVTRQTPEYFDILKQVTKYLHKYCNHNVVVDLIDIDPDRSKTISYCTICGNTL
jgi:hypothetical protein